MIPKIGFLSNGSDKTLYKVLLFLPLLIVNILICLLDIVIILINGLISSFKSLKNIAIKKYKNEFAYIGFISIVIMLLFILILSKKPIDGLFLANMNNGLLITFIVIFCLGFITSVILYFLFKKKEFNNKLFWVIRGISYFLTAILLTLIISFSIFFINKDTAIFKELFDGFWKTILLFVITLALALPLGLILAFGSMSKLSIINKPVKLLIWIIRGTPLMLQILVVSFLPMIFKSTNRQITDALGIKTATLLFIYVALAFVINYACYFSEIYRSGIQSVPKGQYEASKVLGMKKGETFFKVILPQVIKRIVPPMSNEIITLVKDTSLAQVLGVIELLSAANHAVNKYVVLTPLAYAAIFYLIFNGVLTICFSKVEKRLGYYEV